MENYKGKRPGTKWKWVIVVIIAVVLQLPCLVTFLSAVYMQTILSIAGSSFADVFNTIKWQTGSIFAVLSVIQAAIVLLIK